MPVTTPAPAPTSAHEPEIRGPAFWPPGLIRALSWSADAVMCGMMNRIQKRSAKDAVTRASLETYIDQCRDLTREAFYAVPAFDIHGAGPDGILRWPSPFPSGHPENDRAAVKLFPGPNGDRGPWVILLHALMSASDIGYRRVAARFHRWGWSVAFPHLPFHYSRIPRGTLNGELAITSDLVRNAKTLRQAVVELRQLCAFLRARGACGFGLLGTSYGGWNAALLSFLEPDIRFLALVQPIADVEAAIWQNPGAATMRRQLTAQGIAPGMILDHAHLISPLHGIPLCDPRSILLTTGRFDKVSPPDALRELARRWNAGREIEVTHGHFGYAALRATLQALEADGHLTTQSTTSPVPAHPPA